MRQKFLNIYGKNCLNVDRWSLIAISLLFHETESCLHPYIKSFQKIISVFYFSIDLLERYKTVAAHFNTIFCAFRKAFGPDSDFLRQFLYFFNAENHDDFLVLLQICRLLLKFVQESGNCYPTFVIAFTVYFLLHFSCKFKQDFVDLSIYFYYIWFIHLPKMISIKQTTKTKSHWVGNLICKRIIVLFFSRRCQRVYYLCIFSVLYVVCIFLFLNIHGSIWNKIQQQQPSLIPLSGVGYMDQMTP